MSYHILHITTPNSSLYAEKGLLFCEYENNEINKIALQDIKSIIIATHGVTFTNNCLAKLMENNVVILHCNNRYSPVGISLPLERIVRTKVFYNQIAQNKDFENKLWKKLLKSKTLNQANNLVLMGCNDDNLFKLINRPLINEANIAKRYWEKYFTCLGTPQKREHKNASDFANICLNYGYAVINSLICRSVIIHGLITGLGIHHSGKYNSTPLVYDLMEPFRAFVDYYLYCFSKKCPKEYSNKNIKSFGMYFAECLRKYRLEVDGKSYKILDVIDIYIEKTVNAYIDFDCENIFLPDIQKQYLHTDKQRNREYEE